jgi:hypothetical protein
MKIFGACDHFQQIPYNMVIPFLQCARMGLFQVGSTLFMLKIISSKFNFSSNFNILTFNFLFIFFNYTLFDINEKLWIVCIFYKHLSYSYIILYFEYTHASYRIGRHTHVCHFDTLDVLSTCASSDTRRVGSLLFMCIFLMCIIAILIVIFFKNI